jgi:CheY-like chemotaxis protein
LDRDYLIVERSTRTHASIMERNSKWPPAQAPAPRERRRSGRVLATGTAIVHGPFAAHARIVDLAVGGLTLLIENATGVPEVGAHVRLDVRLDGLGRWWRLIGSVARVDARATGQAVVIELLVGPPDFEDLVQDELLSELECAHVPRVLLVDGARGRRDLVASAFRAIGYEVIEVSSPLEAIAEIDQSRLHLWAVVVADSKLASHADELRSFLREAHPSVPLIDVSQHARRLATASPSVDRTPFTDYRANAGAL